MANNDLESELVSFRHEWQNELKSSSSGKQEQPERAVRTASPRPSSSPSIPPSPTLQHTGLVSSTEQAGDVEENDDDTLFMANSRSQVLEDDFVVEEKAKKLFLKGVSLERNGYVYEALKFYRKAMQLVPDIEFKITDFCNSSDEEDDGDHDNYNISFQNFGGDGIPEISNLANEVHHLSVSGRHVCEKEFESRMTHISAIPIELLMYIFKWVVSTNLDFRSLEQLSKVCKGFYVCARDMDIWRLGCLRVWGVDCELPLKWNDSWRSMMINRPHIWTAGVYISKTSYLRRSEQLQDIWSLQLVNYFRYMRFFNDGTVHVLTTTDEPHLIIPKFNQPGLSVMPGHYNTMEDKLVIQLEVNSPIDSYTRGRKGKISAASGVLENKFHMEMEIRSSSYRRRHNQLVWQHYSHHKTYRDTGETMSSEFDITTQFPPFFFSCVLSYTKTASAPLE